MSILEFIRFLGRIVPLEAVGYDRDAVGLQVGSAATELTKVLFAYEVTQEVIEEARATKSNLIVAFHPLIFPNISSLTDASRTGKLIRELVRADIALYVQHTAFDTQREFGTSRLMAEALGLVNILPLQPLSNTLDKIVVFAPRAAEQAIKEALGIAGAGKVGDYDVCAFQVEGEGSFRGNAASNPATGERNRHERVEEVRIEMICERWNTAHAVRAMIAHHPYEEVAYDIIPLANKSVNFGMGALGNMSKAMPLEELLIVVKKTFGSKTVRYNPTSRNEIARIAMVGGSGMEFYNAAVLSGAGAFITADVRYHDFHRARHDNILLIDAGHAETERFVVAGMLRAARVAVANPSIDPKSVEGLLIASQAQVAAVCYF